MTQRIIDDLESIEIDEEHRKSALEAPRGLDGEMQQPIEHLAIWQIGQAVVRGEIFNSFISRGFFVGAVEVVERE